MSPEIYEIKGGTRTKIKKPLTSVPTLTCPCSTNLIPACKFCTIPVRAITTANRLLANFDTDNFSTSDNGDVADGRSPMLCNFVKMRLVYFARGPEGGS